MKTTLSLSAAVVFFYAAPHMAAQPVAAQPALKEAFSGKFLIGAALDEAQFTEQNAIEAALVEKHFNTISPENVMKWEQIHPRPGEYNFAPADRYVQFGERYGMFIVGHNLIWHQQTPRWVFEDGQGNPVSRDVLLNRMREHIHSVVGRYKGRVRGWDVVNEALAEDGSLRATPWFKILGEEYLIKAFEFAHEADPAAELYYNDYSLENATKRRGAIALVKELQAADVPITGIGTQTHINMQFPTIQQEDDTILELGQLGLKVMVTELDINLLPSADSSTTADPGSRIAGNPALNPYRDGLPEAMQQALAQRYADLFRIFVKHSNVLQRVTFWGVTDADSWLNNWPIRGRTSYPLLFDRDGKPKPAFSSVVETAVSANRAQRK